MMSFKHSNPIKLKSYQYFILLVEHEDWVWYITHEISWEICVTYHFGLFFVKSEISASVKLNDPLFKFQGQLDDHIVNYCNQN